VRALAATATSALAFALYVRVEAHWFLLGWIGLMPWLASLSRAGSLRAALGLGLLMSVAFTLAVFWWFVPAIAGYTGVAWPVALTALVLLAPFLQPQFLGLAAARHLVRIRGASGWHVALTSALAYVATEWVYPKLFGDTIGHGFYASALMRQAADLTGAHGLTFVLVLANECVLAATQGLADPGGMRLRRVAAPIACVAALVVGLLGYGSARSAQLAARRGDAPPATVAVVQADLAHHDRLRAELGTFGAVRRVLDAHYLLSEEARGRAALDLLVWPETVYPTTFGAPKSPDGAAFDREIGGFVARASHPLVFGAYDGDGRHEFNAAVFLEPVRDGALTFDTYRKAWLFPLTERVPAWLEGPSLRRWLPWSGTATPGSGPAVLTVTLPGGRNVRVAPLICYDAVDPAFARAAVRGGAELIVTLSNDGWFAIGLGPLQHLVVSAFRSLETRRPQIRATTTGVSAIIGPTGELLASAGVHERAALVATVVPERAATTLFLAWGNWLGPGALVGALALLLTAGARRGTRVVGPAARDR
jgi:apolipoprotein N-acyltransferase